MSDSIDSSSGNIIFRYWSIHFEAQSEGQTNDSSHRNNPRPIDAESTSAINSIYPPLRLWIAWLDEDVQSKCLRLTTKNEEVLFIVHWQSVPSEALRTNISSTSDCFRKVWTHRGEKKTCRFCALRPMRCQSVFWNNWRRVTIPFNATAGEVRYQFHPLRQSVVMHQFHSL